MASETYSRHLIRIARRQSGLTQKMLAERAGTSQAAVSAYESARRSPSVDTLCRLLGAAGYEVRMRLAPADTHGPSSQPPRRCCRPINSEYSENVNESDWSDNESMPDLDVAAIVRTLNRHHVKYVIIGGIAHRSTVYPSRPPSTSTSLRRGITGSTRLAKVFDEIEAGLYESEAAGTWFPRAPVDQWAQYDTLHLMTTFGPIDIVFTPDGAPSGYLDLREKATQTTVDDEPVMVITVSAWVTLKQATGRTSSTSSTSIATTNPGASTNSAQMKTALVGRWAKRLDGQRHDRRLGCLQRRQGSSAAETGSSVAQAKCMRP